MSGHRERIFASGPESVPRNLHRREPIPVPVCAGISGSGRLRGRNGLASCRPSPSVPFLVEHIIQPFDLFEKVPAQNIHIAVLLFELVFQSLAQDFEIASS